MGHRAGRRLRASARLTVAIILVCAAGLLARQVANEARKLPVKTTAAIQADIRAVRENPSVKSALRYLDVNYGRFVEEMVSITEIPAPPFKEQARARYVADLMRQAGLKNVHIDEEGNAIGERPGANNGPTLALSAHLDTVFPEETDVKVKKNGTLLSAPGIGDDSHGLAAMLAVARALEAAQVRHVGSILFVADVGEEGLGNLRGMRHLFEKSPLRRRIDMFISLDGTGDSVIINGAVASKRYRVTFKGPGGHSYGAFGLVNPAYAMAGAAQRFSRFQVPRNPKTTFNIGSYGGGASVNSIPSSVWMEVDMRSESTIELAKLDRRFLAAIAQAVAEENRVRSTEQGMVAAETKMVGERKGGQTPAYSPIVQTALEVTRLMGVVPSLAYSSTDSNVPIALGIPAITLGSGGRGGRAHALDEWVDVDKSSTLPGLNRVLLICLSLVGVQ